MYSRASARPLMFNIIYIDKKQTHIWAQAKGPFLHGGSSTKEGPVLQIRL